MNSSSIPSNASSLARTQIYISSAQQAALAAMALHKRSSSSALIREAVDAYLSAHQGESKLAQRLAVAGAWQPNTDASSLEALRREERKF